ncbi:transporter substrate-binding domain-containing protein [Paraburkholderia sp. UYCP14C]|uniref:substrate-binding periplasmic protein n=1 Tax=Paraburkholderia sp. UYCP14C TaxID=2511130 RepID=UPI001020BDB7|nr:transporter substrate-binding domain-containing protein [Paraburkholderia sp. UYCP14C]RZF24215.1 transporter substrate-binding domain-containing protein [Paraburkholderia sp. UYCP14C]
MRQVKCAFLLVGAAIISAASFAQPAVAQQRLVFGFDGSFPPFASIDAAGQMHGFDVDLVKAVCDELKAKCELKNIPWDGIFTALESGKIDVVAAALNITDERKKKYLMTTSYLKSPFVFMVPKASNVSSAPSLSGQAVGVVGGSIPEKYLREKLKSISVQGYDSIDAAVLDLDAGRVAAVFSEQVNLEPAFVRAKPGVYKIVGSPVEDPAYVGQGKGFALQKDKTELLQKINQALAKIDANGERSKLSVKWFGTQVTK